MDDQLGTTPATAIPTTTTTTTNTTNTTNTNTTETISHDVAKATISALLSYSSSPPINRQPKSATKFNRFHELLPQFSGPLKSNFENKNLWLRFGLTLALSGESPHSALQAFSECMRIDQNDPLPAMLAARLLLEKLDDPEKGLNYAREAIDRCERLAKQAHLSKSPSAHLLLTSSNHITTISNSKSQENSSLPSNSYSQYNNCYYRNITPILSKCYLLASIIHSHIYERKPESMRNFDTISSEQSKRYLDLAVDIYKSDYLVYFHKALQNARLKAHPDAIDNLRQAIKLNPSHLPSIRLLILSLSAVRLLDEALLLCESTINDFELDYLLLYIKCHLEQRLVETKGYKSALGTAQHMLKCIRRATCEIESSNGTASTATLTATHINTPPATLSTTTPAVTLTTTTTTNEPILATDIAKQHQQQQQSLNLFARDESEVPEKSDLTTSELPVWLLVAEIFVKIGAVEDAEMCVDEGAIHANGALSYKVMFIRGLIAKAKNNLMEAKAYFQSCLALCPRHAKALQQVAHVHYLLGNHSIAEKFLRDSLDVDRANSKSWDYLRLVHIEQNQRERAKKCEQELESLDGSSPVIPLSAISHLTLK